MRFSEQVVAGSTGLKALKHLFALTGVGVALWFGNVLDRVVASGRSTSDRWGWLLSILPGGEPPEGRLFDIAALVLLLGDTIALVAAGWSLFWLWPFLRCREKGRAGGRVPREFGRLVVAAILGNAASYLMLRWLTGVG